MVGGVGGGVGGAGSLFALPGLVAGRGGDDDDDDEGEDSMSADALLMGSPPKSTKSNTAAVVGSAFGASNSVRPRVTSPAPLSFFSHQSTTLPSSSPSLASSSSSSSIAPHHQHQHQHQHQPLSATSFRGQNKLHATVASIAPVPLQQIIFDDTSLAQQRSSDSDDVIASSRSMSGGSAGNGGNWGSASAFNSNPTTARGGSENIDLLYGSFNLQSSVPINHGQTKHASSHSSFLSVGLIADPILQCYYDPRTHKYYEIK